MKNKLVRIAAISIMIVVVSVIVLYNLSQSSPSSDQTEVNSTLGKTIYDSRCAMCHGTTGKGDGYAAPWLHPRPRDFTEGKYKFRSTESGSIPTDDDLRQVVLNGLHGTSMPDWKPFITGDSLAAVIEYIKSLSPRFAMEQPKPVTLAAEVPGSRVNIEAGKMVYENLQCASCHGTDGKGKGAVATDLIDDWGNELAATDLTEPWNFRSGSTPKDIYLRFLTGIDGTPMPSFIGSASDKEMWNLAYYVASLSRKPTWSMSEAEIKEHYSHFDQQNKANPIERGKYLVRMFDCAGCHTPYTEDGHMMEQLRFAGGLKWSVGPYGNVTSYNLTSDKETGIGNWTDDEIKRTMTKGIRKDGSRSLPFPMPWTSYANIRDEDLHAVIAYLRTLPPIYNKIPEPESLNIFSYLWGKFKMLILKKDFVTTVTPGNAGMVKEKPTAAEKEAHQ